MDRVFILENREEYFWLMDYLEKLGCMWSSGVKPTRCNSDPFYCIQRYISVKDNIISCAYQTGKFTTVSVKKLRSFTPLSLKQIT